MVKVAVAGANSGLALEVIDKLVEDQKHEVIALCRRDPAQFPQQPNVKWVQVSFDDKAELVEQFQGVDVVLNFIVVNTDPDNTVGKLLVDAAVEAGVRRFAPSEWAMGPKLHDAIENIPWYKSKLAIQAYLREINREKKVIEYCLFQPGMFLEYIGHPVQTTKHVPTMDLFVHIKDRRIVAVRGREDVPLVLTSVNDIAGVVRLAVEYEGVWPEVGGIQGARVSLRQVKEVAERIIGEPITLDLVEQADVDAGVLKIELPYIIHPSIPEDQREAWHVTGWTGLLSATGQGAWDVTDEWNRILPDYEFVKLEDFLQKVWGKK